MHILSNYKDYYDYLVGVYGVDDKIVLDRRKHKQYDFDLTYQTNGHLPIIANIIVAGFIYGFVYEDGIFYYGQSIIDKYGEPSVKNRWLWEDRHEDRRVYVDSIKQYVYIDPIQLNPKRLHEAETIELYFHENNRYPFPVLSKMQFGKCLPPQDIYLKLVDYLSPKDKDAEPLTDKEKIVGAGFDLKTSFRGK